MIWLLRLLVVLQLLLGLGLSRALLGMRPLGQAGVEGDVHMLTGILLAIAAIAVIQPRPGAVIDWIARFGPIVPLLVGLAVRFGGMTTPEVVIVHIVLGLLSIALIEIAIAQGRRQARAPAPATE